MKLQVNGWESYVILFVNDRHQCLQGMVHR